VAAKEQFLPPVSMGVPRRSKMQKNAYSATAIPQYYVIINDKEVNEKLSYCK